MGKKLLASVLCVLPLTVGLAQAPSEERPIPSPIQWTGSQQPPNIDTHPPLHPAWIANAEASLPPVLTDKVAVVSSCSQDLVTCYVQAFDLVTGTPTKRALLSRTKGDATFPRLYPQGKDTFVVYDGELLTEYDEHLKTRTRLRLPAGMGLAPAQGYGYGDWAKVTHLENCTGTGVSLFNLGGGRKLVVGCGAMGVLDSQWKLIFAESYKKPYGFGWPAVSQDGERFILPISLGYPEPPMHKTVGFALYDLRGKSSRKFVFRTANDHSGSPALSPDGKRLALLGKGGLSVYELPD